MAALQKAQISGKGSSPSRPKLGELLLADGALSRAGLAEALRRQRRSGARLGEVVAAYRLAAPCAVDAALCRQSGLLPADLVAEPPDPTLASPVRLAAMIARRCIPWKRDADGAVVVATPDPARLDKDLPGLGRALGLPRNETVRLAQCGSEAFEAALLALHPAARAERAADRTPVRLSVRGLARRAPRSAIGAGFAAAVGATILMPSVLLPVLFAAVLLINALNVALRVAVCVSPPPLAPPPPLLRRDPALDRGLPRITILVALYREPEVVGALLSALAALDWPRERLEVLLALEADDHETGAAVAMLDPPPWVRVIPVPAGQPRTKPRALNHALDFAAGDIIGVYDAEDRPEPLQLRRAAAALAEGPARLVCVQARLGIWNDEDGWIPRCFALEYATWFRVVLPGMARLGLPLTLAGTSFFIRRRALERIGGWDAWNVTEDADLGIRLARAGYVTGLLDSETAEEGVRRPWAWLRQRSRWQKGFLFTWLVHMRSPERLWRELGPRGFLGFQALFLGNAAAFLGGPLLLAAWIWWTSLSGGLRAAAPDWAVLALLTALHGGQLAMAASAVLGARRSGRAQLARWAALLPFYWPLGTLSALKAMGEAVLAPTFWDKTAHGQAGPPGSTLPAVAVFAEVQEMLAPQTESAEVKSDDLLEIRLGRRPAGR